MDRWDLFVWVLAPAGALVALSGAAVCWLKGKRVWGLVGGVASVLAVSVMVSSWTADPANFEDLVAAIAFVYVVVPLTVITLAGATQRARPGSWWVRHRPGGGSKPSVQAPALPRD